MESKIENISNNQGVIDLFKGLIGSNLSLKNGIESDNFSSMLEKFSSKNSNDKNIVKKDNVLKTKEVSNDSKNIAFSNDKNSNNIKKSDNKSSNEVNNRVRKNEIQKTQNESIEDNKIKPIKTESKKVLEEEDTKEIEKLSEDNEKVEVFEISDENDLDVTFKLDEELISKIMSALENTNKFSQNELQTIKDALKETSETFSELNLKDLFDNLKDFLESTNLTVNNLDDFIKNVQDVVKEFFDENKITLNVSEINNETNEKIDLVTNKNQDLETKETGDEKSNVALTFEKILNDILKANFINNESEDNKNSTNFDYNFNNLLKNNTNNNQDNIRELINSNFRELINEGTIENSSMISLEKNFNNTQDIIKTLNIEAKNLVDVNLKKDVSLKTLDSVTSLRVLERVEEVLKAVSSSKDGSTISLRLDPPSLGEVKVDISYKYGSLFARIIAESQEVENLLKSKANELYQVLRDSGLDSENVNVFIASKDSSLNFEGNNENKNDSSFKNNLKVVKENTNISENNEIKLDVVNQISDSKWIA